MSIVIPQLVVDARIADLDATVKGYGARKRYAQSLVDISEGVLWYTDGVALPPVIEAEKKEYYKGMKASGGSYADNPSNAWKMVKKYCVAYAKEIGLIAKPEAEAEAEAEAKEESSGDTRHTRSYSLRVLDEIVPIFKAGRKLEKEGALSDKERACNTHLAAALAALGVDISKL